MAPQRLTVGITGGAGYIGSSLAKHLSQSFNVKILDMRPPRQEISNRVEFQACDIRNFDETKKKLEDVDLVIHTAIIQIPTINEKKKLGYEVNFLGTHNVCKAVDENSKVKGMILAGSWHTIGEMGLTGIINEEFGFRPDKVEDRARLYALSKIAQESILRFYDEMSEKTFGIIRMGTVLGEGMPEKTAVNIFIENGLGGKPLTPFKHSMFRPMVYVNIRDICRAYEVFARKILNGELEKRCNSLEHIFNVYYPEPVTILELAKIVKDAITELSKGKIKPKIEVINTGQPCRFAEEDKKLIKLDVSKAMNFLELRRLMSVEESIREIISMRMEKLKLSEAIEP